jgi:hypothetical protein
VLNSRRIILPRVDRLINQTCTLERSVSRAGKDQIDHPTHGHDDLINAVSGVAAVVLRRTAWKPPKIVQPTIFSNGRFWENEKPLPASALPREIATSPCAPPTGGNYGSSATQLWYGFSSGRRGRWPGS